MQFITLKTVFFTFSVIALTACGGGGSKSASPVPEPGASSSSLLSSSAVSSSLVSRSSSSSSSSIAASCTNSVGDVFINSACLAWRSASIYERFTAAPSTFREIRDGSPGNLVTQKIIDSGIAGHDQVLDIQYNSRSPELNGIVRMFNPESEPDGIDMSLYATGKLVFDVKLINAGDDQPDLEVVIECGWPCNTHPHKIRPSELNRWQTFELSIKDLIAEGLNIKQVTTGFLIVPTWGRQANVHFQLDNIRWVKGAAEPVKETVCFANHFDFNQWDKASYYFRFISFAGAAEFDSNAWLLQFVPEVVIRPQWDMAAGLWGFATTEPLVEATKQPLSTPSFSQCASRGTLSAEVYLPANYVVDGKMRVGLYILNSLGFAYGFNNESLSASAMTANGWTTLKVNLDDYPPIYDAVHMGVYFDPNGKSTSVSGDIKIDNFVIKHSVAP